MKKFLFSILALCSAAIAMSQNPVVATSNSNVLYAGISNKVLIAVPGVQADNLIVYSKELDISHIEQNQYSFVVKGDNMQAEVKFFSINGNDSTYHGSQLFKIKRIPLPDITIANKVVECSSINLQKSELQAFPKLGFSYNEDLIDFNLPLPVVTQFTVEYEVNDKIESKQVMGNTISNSVINAILSMPKDKPIFFEDIYFINAGATRVYGGFEVFVF